MWVPLLEPLDFFYPRQLPLAALLCLLDLTFSAGFSLPALPCPARLLSLIIAHEGFPSNSIALAYLSFQSSLPLLISSMALFVSGAVIDLEERGILDDIFGGGNTDKKPDEPTKSAGPTQPSEPNPPPSSKEPPKTSEKPSSVPPGPTDSKPVDPTLPPSSSQPPQPSERPNSSVAPTQPQSPLPTSNNPQPKSTITSGTITSFTTAPFSSGASGSAITSATPGAAVVPLPKPQQDESGGQLMTAGIAIACVVVAAGIGIFVFRKWKLSPSRRFKEDRLGDEPTPAYTMRSKETDSDFLRHLQES
ncbi:uncharacterized protein VTP21DRAFT_9253 [Calcarisporiella thermophila]|uniref:uncharacterized protein n=1 Tax=Calcarisporiella thermophila TaxID=911321 RepID=UPI0037449E8B